MSEEAEEGVAVASDVLLVLAASRHLDMLLDSNPDFIAIDGHWHRKLRPHVISCRWVGDHEKHDVGCTCTREPMIKTKKPVDSHDIWKQLLDEASFIVADLGALLTTNLDQQNEVIGR